ncbi:MAG: ATP-dependent RecD-like DNA helicase [Christensenellales bacterium]
MDSGLVADELEDMIMSRRVNVTELSGEEVVALPAVYRSEKNAAVLLGRLIDSADRTDFDADADIDKYEKLNDIKLHSCQRQAVAGAVRNGVMLVTGGPGTGKTTIIKCVIDVFEKLGRTVMLMAPTGRAAKRMSEATGKEASTIHRACKINSEGCGCEKLAADVIVVDEFSMVDVFLFEALLKRVPDGSRLLLVGDKDQLPSVGAGNVLADIMRSGAVKTVELTQIYRQAEQSLIVTNAHAVNRGEMPDLNVKDRDFFYLSASEPEIIADKTVDMVGRAARYIGVEADRVQVLCPMKNGAAGAININKRLQTALNGDEKTGITEGDYVYRAGDKVMHIVNNYDLEWKIASGYTYREGTGVFNGDIGTVTEVAPARGEMTVEFEDGRIAVYTPEIFNQLSLAYAITVHKSQGSEFDAVIMPITAGGPMIMTRNLLYTAITRAKKMVVLIGDRYWIKSMVDNNYVAKRYSLLTEFLLGFRSDSAKLFGERE